MKRTLALILLTIVLAVSLFGCSKPENTAEKPLKIGVLSGTTGMGAAKLIEDLNALGGSSERYESIKIYSDPSAIMSDMISGTIDIAAMPTNAASTLYNKSQKKVSVLALNTLGVLYLLDNTGSVNSLNDLSGKTIHVATPGQTPEYILKHVLAEAGIENVTISTEYTDLDSLATAAASGIANIALLPEPKVTAALTQAKKAENSKLKVAIDLTSEWDKLEDTSVTQGCIVAQKEVIENYPTSVKSFLQDYKASIEYITNPENLDAAANTIANAGIIPKAPIAKTALPKCNIVYIDGEEMKNTMSSFLEVLFEMDKTAVGGALPEDDFYYIAK